MSANDSNNNLTNQSNLNNQSQKNLEEAKKSGKVEILSRDQTLVKKVIDAEVKERQNNNLKKNTESKK